MALKSNTRKALENLYKYIREYSEDYLQDNYSIDPEQISTKSGLYKAIYDIFRKEMRPDLYRMRQPERQTFTDWAQGLAMGGLFCYYYNREAAADLAAILEETPEDVAMYKNKYTRSEEVAEEYLTNLIYREIRKEA